MSSTVFDEIRTVASDLFGVPAQKINAASSPKTIDTWDSIQHLNLVLALEDKFGVQLSPEETEGMKSIDAIVKIVEGKLRAAAK